jgi:hypothetical protein
VAVLPDCLRVLCLLHGAARAHESLAHIPKRQRSKPSGGIPSNVLSGRAEARPPDRKVLRAIWNRRGQPEFRNNLIKAYAGRCAATGCDVLDALEAAHIFPYATAQTYAPSDGLLLRADMHTLFDLYMISVDPTTWTIRLAPSLAESYRELRNKPIKLPRDASLHPSGSKLQDHFAQWRARWCGD